MFRHMVECRGCGAKYKFDAKRKTPKNYTNKVPCEACGEITPHTVIIVAELIHINIDDLKVQVK